MICPNCNAVIADGSAFCTVCGGNVSQYAPSMYAPLQTPPTPAAPAGVAAATPVTTVAGVEFDFSNNGAAATSEKKKLYQYKVLSQKDKWFSGKFDPMVLEQAINSYAQQGWRVIGCATADIPGFGNARQEFITLMEREL